MRNVKRGNWLCIQDTERKLETGPTARFHASAQGNTGGAAVCATNSRLFPANPTSGEAGRRPPAFAGSPLQSPVNRWFNAIVGIHDTTSARATVAITTGLRHFLRSGQATTAHGNTSGKLDALTPVVRAIAKMDSNSGPVSFLRRATRAK